MYAKLMEIPWSQRQKTADKSGPDLPKGNNTSSTIVVIVRRSKLCKVRQKQGRPIRYRQPVGAAKRLYIHGRMFARGSVVVVSIGTWLLIIASPT